MSLDNYLRLQAHSQDDPALLGCQLPRVNNGQLNIEYQQGELAVARATINEFDADHGWVMLRDAVQLTPEAPSRDDVIEGEWCKTGNGQTETLKLKLLGPGQYALLRFTAMDTVAQENTAADVQQGYAEQAVTVRSGLSSSQPRLAHYRLWWQCTTDGTDRGRWKPLAQQFIGFDQETD